MRVLVGALTNVRTSREGGPVKCELRVGNPVLSKVRKSSYIAYGRNRFGRWLKELRFGRRSVVTLRLPWVGKLNRASTSI